MTDSAECSLYDEEEDSSLMDSGFSGSLQLTVSALDSRLLSEFTTLKLDGEENDEENKEKTTNLENSKNSVSEYYEVDEDGDIQLHLAIASGFVDVVYALIRLAPSPDYLNITNHQNYAPLHIAVLQNQPSVVKRLVSSGARLDVRDSEGNTPLHLASSRGYLECGKGLRINESSFISILNCQNAIGEHAIHLATMGNHVNFLRFLSSSGGDVNSQDGRGGRSALHFAVGSQNIPLITILLESPPKGLGLNPHTRDWYGRSPYRLALDNSLPHIASLIASKMDIESEERFFESFDSSSSEELEIGDEVGSKATIISA